MRTFIEDYLSDPSQAISKARLDASSKLWNEEFDEDMIYNQIASPEFRLYEEIILSSHDLSIHPEQIRNNMNIGIITH